MDLTPEKISEIRRLSQKCAPRGMFGDVFQEACTIYLERECSVMNAVRRAVRKCSQNGVVGYSGGGGERRVNASRQDLNEPIPVASADGLTDLVDLIQSLGEHTEVLECLANGMDAQDIAEYFCIGLRAAQNRIAKARQALEEQL